MEASLERTGGKESNGSGKVGDELMGLFPRGDRIRNGGVGGRQKRFARDFRVG